MRNLEAEKEMKAISNEVWQAFGKQKSFMPDIYSKEGGSVGCYYSDRGAVYFRWNSWNKMPLAHKRLLVIHELYHALGNDHNGMFCHSMDFLSLEIYKLIYGEDAIFIAAQKVLVDLAKETVLNNK